MSENTRFLKEGSGEAIAVFTGKLPLSQEGFELCIREMIRLQCDQLYTEFTGRHPDMLECFLARIEESLGRDGQMHLTDEEKDALWEKIKQQCPGEKARGRNIEGRREEGT